LRSACAMTLSLLMLVCSLPARAAAQGDHEVGADLSACVPPCRAGFFCREGRCVSTCNPPCGGGELCTRNGTCIPSDPRPAAASSVATRAEPARVLPVLAEPGRPGANAAAWDPDFDLAGARAKANAGAFFLTRGGLGFVAAPDFGGNSGATGEDEFLLIGIGIEAASLLFFVPGLVALVKNNKLIRLHGGVASRTGGSLSLTMAF